MMIKTTRRKSKLFIGMLVISLAVIYLVVTAARGATAYYLTVAEIIEQGPSTRQVRVAGEALGDTIAWNPSNNMLSFDIVDADGADTYILSVIHYGSRPDMLLDRASVVLEGRYTDQGTFRADRLLLQCPSKYEAP
jgi:cytochrome c-type biogenesis protein CcmE